MIHACNWKANQIEIKQIYIKNLFKNQIKVREELLTNDSGRMH